MAKRHNNAQEAPKWEIVNLLGRDAYFDHAGNPIGPLEPSGELRVVKKEKIPIAKSHLARITGGIPIVTIFCEPQLKMNGTGKSFRQAKGKYYLVTKDVAEVAKWVRSMRSEYFIYPKAYYQSNSGIYIAELGMVYSGDLKLEE